MNDQEYQAAIEQLNEWTRLYDEGHPVVSDKEWDDLYYKILEHERTILQVKPNSPTHFISYTVVNKLEKVTHNHPMLSLAKTKEIQEVESFMGSHELVAMSKMDGLTCSLRYVDGKLVSAETRGDGYIGEDITHNIKFAKGVPLTINCTHELIVDGEIICCYSDFKKYQEIYKNPRNFASGSIRLLDSGESAKRHLTFVAWDCINGLKAKTLDSKLFQLDQLGFYIVPYLCIIPQQTDLNHAVFLLKKVSEDFSYPIDGIVFKYRDCEYYDSLGTTSHHANGGLAFKFYDETYSTTLKNIEWTMGRMGQLTPVAVFEPIEIDGTIVERASVHNLSILKQTLGEHPWIGQKLEVSKRNMIIPQIEWAEKDD